MFMPFGLQVVVRCWGLKSGPLQEQCALFTAKLANTFFLLKTVVILRQGKRHLIWAVNLAFQERHYLVALSQCIIWSVLSHRFPSSGKVYHFVCSGDAIDFAGRERWVSEEFKSVPPLQRFEAVLERTAFKSLMFSRILE